MNLHFIANVVLHIACVYIFLSVFYFKYRVKHEKGHIVSTSVTPQSDEQNEQLIKKNKKIVTTLIVLILVILLYSYFQSKKGVEFHKSLNLTAVFKEVLAIVFFVSMAEIFFYKTVETKYVHK